MTTYKTLNEYLTESKKVYSFKIKLAGDVPKEFEKEIKERLERCKVVSFDKSKTTPIQKELPEFPTLSNVEVTIYNVVLEYPITSPEIGSDIEAIGVPAEYFKVQGSSEPGLIDPMLTPKPTGEALLDDPDYKEANEVPVAELAGEEYNQTFLQDLASAAKEREKTLGHDKTDPDVLSTHSKGKEDKVGTKSAIGSK